MWIIVVIAVLDRTFLVIFESSQDQHASVVLLVSKAHVSPLKIIWPIAA